MAGLVYWSEPSVGAFWYSERPPVCPFPIVSYLSIRSFPGTRLFSLLTFFCGCLWILLLLLSLSFSGCSRYSAGGRERPTADQKSNSHPEGCAWLPRAHTLCQDEERRCPDPENMAGILREAEISEGRPLIPSIVSFGFCRISSFSSVSVEFVRFLSSLLSSVGFFRRFFGFQGAW